MSRFVGRRYERGDELGINQLYYEITGRERSVEQWRWQWMEAPAGPGDIFVIVDNEHDGRIVGHHGVMPIRFANGDDDLLFGKTENTMLLPSYQDKLVYLRHEKNFKEQYEHRYHALFSTMGPSAAIRLRKALGYSSPVEWRASFLRASRIPLKPTLSWLTALVLREVIRAKKAGTGSKQISQRLVAAGFLEPLQAAKSEFLKGFWRLARGHQGITPSRDQEDLNWRFWTNPYKPHYLLQVDEVNLCGYAVVSVSEWQCKLEDVLVLPNTVQAYDELMRGLLKRLSAAKFSHVGSVTTTDQSSSSLVEALSPREIRVPNLLRKLRGTEVAKMPRLITGAGKNCNLPVNDWYVTPIIMEGR